MSAIESLLSAFDVRVEPFAICDVRSGWRLRLAREDTVSVHYALAGRGTIRVGGGEAVPFASDTLIIAPRGLSQEIAAPGATRTCTGAQVRCVPLRDGLQWLSAGDGGQEVVMACGRIKATFGESMGFFDLLEAPIVEPFAPAHAIRPAFRALLAEMAQPRLGSRALAESLMKQCLIYAARALAERADGRLPWLAALRDRRLAAAVDAMLNRPEDGLTVEALADLAGMSRSAFCAHFAQAFGQAPHGFLIEHRLRRAARYLRTTGLPIKTIAGKIGYRSRSNFSRAFKAQYGVDPASFRRDGVKAAGMRLTTSAGPNPCSAGIRRRTCAPGSAPRAGSRRSA